MKNCSKCKIDKPLFEFGIHKQNKDGLQYYCKVCRKNVCATSFKNISEEQKQKRVSQTLAWRLKNKEFIANYNKLYKSINRPKMTSIQRKRELSKINRTPDWLTDFDYLKMDCIYQVAAMRTRESGEKWNVDHIIPLQGKIVSGLHVPSNLRIIPASENMRKNNLYEV